MEQPRPRPASPDLIIENPALQSTGQKVLYGTLTVVFWAIWIYLWLPLITLAGWSFGLFRFMDIMVVRDGLTALRGVLMFYLFVVAVMGGSLILWALYNRIRFSGRERRTSRRDEHSSPHIARALGKRESVVLIWQNQKTLRVSHHPDGRIALVESGKAAIRSAPPAGGVDAPGAQPGGDTSA